MKRFVDASAWIALADRDDQNHDRAAAFLKQHAATGVSHTSNYVISETVTRLRRTAGPRVAWKLFDDLHASDLVRIHYSDEALDQEAIRLFKKYEDQELSFVDCTTAAILDRMGIDEIFAFDDDFRRVGYTVVPGD